MHPYITAKDYRSFLTLSSDEYPDRWQFKHLLEKFGQRSKGCWFLRLEDQKKGRTTSTPPYFKRCRSLWRTKHGLKWLQIDSKNYHSPEAIWWASSRFRKMLMLGYFYDCRFLRNPIEIPFVSRKEIRSSTCGYSCSWFGISWAKCSYIMHNQVPNTGCDAAITKTYLVPPSSRSGKLIWQAHWIHLGVRP